ncbi:MAG: DEAD/DEAH box helicase [Gammaproteobacteria bacterium]|nr:DEAD/DEAH box helicase [Gammaproteobacteria bacterium]
MFADLSLHKLLQKILGEKDFQLPTPVQEQVIPLALAGRDLLVSAETGSGKTLAFVLPMLDRFLRRAAPGSGIRGLILAPTRELARQVFKQCQQYMKPTRLQVGLIMGGETFKYQRAMLRKNPEIIIATPGRLLEHFEHGNPDLRCLECLVLDEADRMLDMGFSEEVLAIVAACNPNRQTLLFSATLKHRKLSSITDNLLNDPETVILSTARDQHSSIQQQIITADNVKHKSELTSWLLHNEAFDKALIFCNKKIQADSLGAFLRYKKHRLGVLHGDMDQERRKHVLQQLRSGTISILVASDVAARGLDVTGIDLVINFDMARNGDDHVHRIGRTGRAGRQGLAISLISEPEWNLMSSIERYLRLHFQRRTIESLAGSYRGPKKLKESGKAAGSKKRKRTAEKKVKPKKKQRHRDKKNVGKRRKPSTDKPGQPLSDGHGPLKKRFPLPEH